MTSQIPCKRGFLCMGYISTSHLAKTPFFVLIQIGTQNDWIKKSPSKEGLKTQLDNNCLNQALAFDDASNVPPYLNAESNPQ